MRPTKCSPPYLQVLSDIGFLATGTFQREIGDGSEISQPSMSLIVPVVLIGIIKSMPPYIKFPHETQRQVEVMQGFSSISNMPGAISAIDCTRVRINAPSGGAFAYINRRNFHSVNVQPGTW